jgi:hypothetical protein
MIQEKSKPRWVLNVSERLRIQEFFKFAKVFLNLIFPINVRCIVFGIACGLAIGLVVKLFFLIKLVDIPLDGMKGSIMKQVFFTSQVK